MTLKDLSLEIDNLKLANVEKDDLIKVLDEKLISLQSWMQQMYSTLSNKMNETDQHHYKNEKILENKITELQDKINKVEEKQETDVTDEPSKDSSIPGRKEQLKQVQCKECSLSFARLCILKKHILVVHPKTIKCNQCDEVFDQNWKLEEHLKIHVNQTNFHCNICDKTFLLQWRLRKHMKGHEQKNVKFCRFFNNNQICKFEEVSGCMFKHEHAPLCQNSDACKIYKCQFSHSEAVDEESNSDSDDDNIDDKSDETDKTKMENIMKPVRCDYGLCDFQTILFKTKSDLKVHLKLSHGIER